MASPKTASIFAAGPQIIQTYVYLFGTWEPDLAAFLRRRLRPGDTFIDVGANIGCLSALAADWSTARHRNSD